MVIALYFPNLTKKMVYDNITYNIIYTCKEVRWLVSLSALTMGAQTTRAIGIVPL